MKSKSKSIGEILYHFSKLNKHQQIEIIEKYEVET